MMLSLGAALLAAESASAINLAAPPSLKTVPRPEPSNLGEFLNAAPNAKNADGYAVPTDKARKAAIQLGKALFWDMKVGSDDVQACATCHFHAGADNRTKNQLNPGLKSGDTNFDVAGPNSTLTAGMFPLLKFNNPHDRSSGILSDKNDVVSSQGIHRTDLVSLNGASEVGNIVYDPVFSVGLNNVRRVAPRNAPSVINAVFNFANFWDGRANNIFNGNNPFGDADPAAGVYVTDSNGVIPMDANGNPQKQHIHLPMSSLASQAVGPPGSDFEMSYGGRSFMVIGKKLLAKIGTKQIPLMPLSKQAVHPTDSVLGVLANSTVSKGKVTFKPGLKTTYTDMIKAAFQDKYWNATQSLDIGGTQYTQMEANFAMFFGLAIQLYEATLISDDSPFDRFQDGNNTAMSPSAQAGLNIFLAQNELGGSAGGSCINCHGGSEFTNASTNHVGATNFGASLPEALLELMTMNDGKSSFYDAGYYNIGVRPNYEDSGRDAYDPFGYPLSFTDRALLMNGGNYSGLLQSLDPAKAVFNPFLPCGQPGFPPTCPDVKRSATLGAFKTPTLRNVELTGPYFHNGGQATLKQVVEFYARGGDFHDQNLDTLAPDIETLFGVVTNETAQNQLVDFLVALTDERVRWEKEPFDHPELYLPNGAPGDNQKVQACNSGEACDTLIKLPAVGAGGLAAINQPPIGTFLGLDPHQP